MGYGTGYKTKYDKRDNFLFVVVACGALHLIGWRLYTDAVGPDLILKIYLLTAPLFGMLLPADYPPRRSACFWKAVVPIILMHSVVPAPSVNCALRTLRRMLHKAEEWNLLVKVPRFKLLPEHGPNLGWMMKRNRGYCWLPDRSTGKRQCSICFGMSSSLLEKPGCETGESSIAFAPKISTGATESSLCPTARRWREEE
jgi:hypothetical protein